MWTAAKGNPPANGQHELYWCRIELDGSVTYEYVRDIRRNSDSIKAGNVAIDPLNPHRIAYSHYDGNRDSVYLVERTGPASWSSPNRLTRMAGMSRVMFLRSRHDEPRLVIGGGRNPEGQDYTRTPGGAVWEVDFETTGFVIDSTLTSPLRGFPY